MFKALVAAKLNVVAGCTAEGIGDVIADADAWMTKYGPIGSEVAGSSTAWQKGSTCSDIPPGEALYELLDAFNNNLLD
jgi:hypothetical protein